MSSQRARKVRATIDRQRYVDALTDSGKEAVIFFVNLARDPDADTRDRIEAWRWLSEHSTAGKETQVHQLDVHHHEGDALPPLDFSQLTLDEVIAYEQLQAKLVGHARALPAAPEEPTIDAELVEAASHPAGCTCDTCGNPEATP